MKIRSITYFFNPGWPPDDRKLQQAGNFLSQARNAYENAGFEVQTVRIATTSFTSLLGSRIKEAPRLAEDMEALLPSMGVEYASLGPALPEVLESYAVIPEALAHSQNIFFSGVAADSRAGISMEALRACAQVIAQCSPITPDGFANLRFSVLANVGPGSPFFPAAYHRGEQPAFAIATQAADLAVEAFTGADTLHAARDNLIRVVEKHGKALASTGKDLSRQFQVDFGGIDFSLAPFPTDEESLGGAVERFGVPKIGLHGSLAAAAILTEAIDRADFPHTGFSGFMQPVLEDSILAQRAAEGVLTIKDLLLYSTVCGTGLDTVPLPGDVTAGQITPLLLDLATLALRLDKPLTARLMPIPGKSAGDPTDFDFEFFANSKVMALDAEPLTGLLSGDKTVYIQPKNNSN
jgi:uncharacterized protein